MVTISNNFYFYNKNCSRILIKIRLVLQILNQFVLPFLWTLRSIRRMKHMNGSKREIGKKKTA